jgi:hypothetical protein
LPLRFRQSLGLHYNFLAPRSFVMHPVLNRNLYFVKEQVGFFKASNNYDIVDPQTQELILTCREDNLGFFTKMFRFTDYKRMTPFEVNIRTPAGEPVVQVKRGITLFVSSVNVTDEKGQRVGGFKQKWFSLGGAFSVLGANDEPLCDLTTTAMSWRASRRSGRASARSCSPRPTTTCWRSRRRFRPTIRCEC